MLKILALLALVGVPVYCDPNVVTKYFDVPLDHFSFTSNATFKIRYLVNDSYHVQRGPIFFYTGNEGDIFMFAKNTGFMFDIARNFNALLIFAEHRYYGESLPFGNKSYDSPTHLGYLSSEQALADFVDLIDYLQETSVTKYLKRVPVVAFGGSYGGMLASWLRMKYPSSVVGAIASSAPIWQFKDIVPCGNFYRITTNVYEFMGSRRCRDVIQQSWKIIRTKGKNDSGKSELTNIFQLCKPLKTDDDIDSLIEWLAEIYINLAMVNYPYPADFLAPLPSFPVKEFCSKLNSGTGDQDILKELSNALVMYTNGTGKTQCNNINVTSEDMGEKGWGFQSCTEMVMPICSTDQDMFENVPWDFQKYSDYCFKEFGIRPRDENIPVRAYGGINLKPYSNIVFSNGLLDPWSAGGVLNNISSTVLAVVIPDGAHHLDLRMANEKDTQAVRDARKFHVRQIQKWLYKYYSENISEKYFIL